jgi:hypothetical protein
MSFIARWLNLARDRRPVGLRPHRDVVVAADFDATFDRVLGGMDGVLGAYVAAQDRDAGTIEAAFGLVNNERVRCTLTRGSDTHTDVRIEAYFPAGSSVREHSRAVDALADYLESTSKPV